MQLNVYPFGLRYYVKYSYNISLNQYATWVVYQIYTTVTNRALFLNCDFHSWVFIACVFLTETRGAMVSKKSKDSQAYIIVEIADSTSTAIKIHNVYKYLA